MWLHVPEVHDPVLLRIWPGKGIDGPPVVLGHAGAQRIAGASCYRNLRTATNQVGFYRLAFELTKVMRTAIMSARANSSVGRASDLHSEGHRFEPCFAHLGRLMRDAQRTLTGLNTGVATRPKPTGSEYVAPAFIARAFCFVIGGPCLAGFACSVASELRFRGIAAEYRTPMPCMWWRVEGECADPPAGRSSVAP